MRYNASQLTAFLLMIVINAGASPKSVESTVKSVRIYQSGAQVERSFTAVLDQGSNILDLEGLSSTIDPNSIQVSGAGDATVMSVKYRLDYLSAEHRPQEVIRLEDSLKLTSKALERINGLEQVYTDEMALMNANRAVGGTTTGIDVDNLREVADYFRERMIELKVKMMDVHSGQRELKETSDRLNKQLAEWNARLNRPRGTIVLTIASKQRSTLKLSLSYFTTGASWTPAYDLRVKQLNDPVKLIYKADVMQSTGEVWDNINLVLSTGNPSLSGTQPVLNTWYLDFFNPVFKQRGAYMNADGAVPPSVMSTEMLDTKGVSGMQDYVTATDQPTTVDFEISMPYSVDPDGKSASVEIMTYDLSASYQYYAAPKQDKDAFLLAKVSGWSGLNLLPGTASIYFEGNYVGNSVLNTSAALDTLDLSLGRDKRILVSRELKKEFSQTRFAGSNVIKEFSYEIKIRNTKKEPVQLVLVDQLPVSRNSDIRVTHSDLSGGLLDESTGRLTWRMDIASSGAESRTFNYAVKYPKDKPIQGLQ